MLDRIGGFDTRFEIGNLEDDDYSLRARLAGFRLWVADDSYVHHFGHKTFALTGEDYDALMLTNVTRYVAKWDLPEDIDPAASSRTGPSTPGRDRLPIA